MEKKEIKKLDSDILEATPEEELETEIERSDAVEEQIAVAVILIDDSREWCGQVVCVWRFSGRPQY